MKDDGTYKNNWSWPSANYRFNFLIFICKNQICSHAFLKCNKTVSKGKHTAVGARPTTWKFVLLSPKSFEVFLFFPPPVVTKVGFFCLSSRQPCLQRLSRYWRYFSKPLKSGKTMLSPWHFSWEKMRSIISGNILVRAIYCTEMLVSPLFLLKLKVLKKMETQIQNHGIKLCSQFLLYFCLSVTKCYWEWKIMLL